MNHTILDRVNASGEAFLTHTVLDGRTVLRVSIGNTKTTEEHVARVWASLLDAAATVDAAVDEIRQGDPVR